VDHRQAAIGAAAKLHHRMHCPVWPACDGEPTELDVAAVRRLLDAAAPHLEAGERERIAALAEKVDAHTYHDDDGSGIAVKIPFTDVIWSQFLAAKLTALGVPRDQQPTYADAIQQDPDWRERLPAVTTRDQLDHYTETGVIPDA
jgi:hypothetical protein